MRTSLLIIALHMLPLLCFSQKQTIKYFNNKYQTKEVSEKKGKYILTTTNNDDGSITEELKHIKSGDVLLRETLKEGEAFGVWIDKISTPNQGFSYDFNVTYNQNMCKNNFPIDSKDAFEDNPDIGYERPTIIEYNDIFHYIRLNISYPNLAKENNAQGQVELSFVITEKGEITEIVINKSVHKHIDKEAVRIIREMEIKEPAKLNGKNISICASTPIKFILE